MLWQACLHKWVFILTLRTNLLACYLESDRIVIKIETLGLGVESQSEWTIYQPMQMLYLMQWKKHTETLNLLESGEFWSSALVALFQELSPEKEIIEPLATDLLKKKLLLNEEFYLNLSSLVVRAASVSNFRFNFSYNVRDMYQVVTLKSLARLRLRFCGASNSQSFSLPFPRACSTSITPQTNIPKIPDWGRKKVTSHVPAFPGSEWWIKLHVWNL